MRLSRVFLVALLALIGLGIGRPEAARDLGATPAGGRRIEILVLEVGNCHICGLLRQTIQPLYAQSPHARQVPMRFVDVGDLDALKLGLNSRIDTVPTTLVMVDGVEADRIAGYWAPDMFMRMIVRMIENAN